MHSTGKELCPCSSISFYPLFSWRFARRYGATATPFEPEPKIFVFFFRKSINSQTGQPLLLNTSLLRDLNGDTAAIFFPSMRVSTKLRNERGKYRTDRIMSRKSDVRSEGESHRLFLQGYNCHKLLTHTRSRVSVLRTHGLSPKVFC